MGESLASERVSAWEANETSEKRRNEGLPETKSTAFGHNSTGRRAASPRRRLSYFSKFQRARLQNLNGQDQTHGRRTADRRHRQPLFQIHLGRPQAQSH
jgi:hypothetical protein